MTAERHLSTRRPRRLNPVLWRLALQPIVSVADGSVDEFEALFRHADYPSGGAPLDLLRWAESRHRIEAIDVWMLRSACELLQDWSTQGVSHGPTRVWVNFSAAHFAAPGTAATVAGILERYEVPSRQIGIEVTETTLLSDMPAAMKTVSELLDIGVLVAIDDFGSGYSSLSYLRTFRVSRVKLARAFSAGIDTDVRGRTVVRGVLAMADSLGAEVVAEGVETRAQSQVLADLGCQWAQGFYYSRAVPPVQAGEMLRWRLKLPGRTSPADPESGGPGRFDASANLDDHDASRDRTGLLAAQAC